MMRATLRREGDGDRHRPLCANSKLARTPLPSGLNARETSELRTTGPPDSLKPLGLLDRIGADDRPSVAHERDAQKHFLHSPHPSADGSFGESLSRRPDAETFSFRWHNTRRIAQQQNKYFSSPGLQHAKPPPIVEP